VKSGTILIGGAAVCLGLIPSPDSNPTARGLPRLKCYNVAP